LKSSSQNIYNHKKYELTLKIDSDMINEREGNLVAELRGKALDKETLFIDDAVVPEDTTGLGWGSYPKNSIRPTQDEVTYWKDVAKKWGEDELINCNPDGGGMVFLQSSLYKKIQSEIDSTNTFDDVTVGNLVYMPISLYSRIQNQIAPDSSYKGDLIGITTDYTSLFAETGYTKSSYLSA
jgi:hypothetical protein